MRLEGPLMAHENYWDLTGLRNPQKSVKSVESVAFLLRRSGAVIGSDQMPIKKSGVRQSFPCYFPRKLLQSGWLVEKARLRQQA
jgi:hypothetical protein